MKTFYKKIAREELGLQIANCNVFMYFEVWLGLSPRVCVWA